ncbi:GGDEF domain-containing protein [Vibrio cholerae]|nr:GGDEF domain-containing protein [Vibrio cholerae]EGR4227748.1 GGDEF domain-containing protein [Vibrio cholerae]EGR4327727.1 GGDEF domain-containing protein [Vibrio cholerae]
MKNWLCQAVRGEPMIELNRIEELFDNQQLSLHELVLNELGVYVFVKNRRGEYLYANPLTLKLFETDAQSLFGKTDHDFFHDDQLSDILAADQQVFETRLSVIHEERAIAKSNGLVRIYRAVKHPILHRVTGEVIGLIGVSTDIIDIVELHEQLYQLANTDSLTQLCNRRKLWADFRAAFARSKRLRQPLSCISIDIDNFKLINDQFGHDKGDEVLCFLAKLFQSVISDHHFCGRVGGEEFIIVLENTHVETAFHLAEQIRQRFAEHPFFEQNEHIYLCAGVSSLHHGDHDIADIYRRSDQALYKAKRNGRNRCCIYRQSTE